MKSDMAGAATVIGLMQLLAMRRAKINAVGVVGLVENMPSGNALRPDDIVHSMSGQSIEIVDTDAEGRLVLADALYYACKKFNPLYTIDLATLTGSIVVALGHEYGGVFSNDEGLSGQLLAAAKISGEKLWPMPMTETYDQLLDSDIADMKNCLNVKSPDAAVAACFLKRFVKGAWAHLDIAGVAYLEESDYPVAQEKKTIGATGYGLALLNQFVIENEKLINKTNR